MRPTKLRHHVCFLSSRMGNWGVLHIFLLMSLSAGGLAYLILLLHKERISNVHAGQHSNNVMHSILKKYSPKPLSAC